MFWPKQDAVKDTKSLRSPAGQTIGGTPELQKADPPSEVAFSSAV
jgi:hypothetical protein